MCNRYRGAREYGRLAAQRMFLPERLSNAVGAEVHPRAPGDVIAADGLQAMSWGFPRPMKGANGQPIKPKAVNNARDDKLKKWFWKDSFAHRRCLIPVRDWAEAAGPEGEMREVRYALPGRDGFMVAGLWRESGEWGRVYAMIMCPASAAMEDVHDRMPVILADDAHRRWLETGPDDALSLCVTWSGDLAVDHTGELWHRPRGTHQGALR